jgi:hypothetical protein
MVTNDQYTWYINNNTNWMELVRTSNDNLRNGRNGTSTLDNTCILVLKPLPRAVQSREKGVKQQPECNQLRLRDLNYMK